MSTTWYSPRGFAQKHTIVGTYPSSGIRVYESSVASGPHLWIEVKDGKTLAAVHMDIENAKEFAHDILDLVEAHYQSNGHFEPEDVHLEREYLKARPHLDQGGESGSRPSVEED